MIFRTSNTFHVHNLKIVLLYKLRGSGDVYNTQSYGASVLCPSSAIIEIRKDNDSATEYVSVLG